MVLPGPTRSCLTYHQRRLWTRDNQYAYVQRRGPGHEFVLDLSWTLYVQAA